MHLLIGNLRLKKNRSFIASLHCKSENRCRASCETIFRKGKRILIKNLQEKLKPRDDQYLGDTPCC